MAKKSLPKVLYIARKNPGEGEYLHAAEDTDELVLMEQGARVIVGKYQLIEEYTARAETRRTTD